VNTEITLVKSCVNSAVRHFGLEKFCSNEIASDMTTIDMNTILMATSESILSNRV